MGDSLAWWRAKGDCGGAQGIEGNSTPVRGVVAFATGDAHYRITMTTGEDASFVVTVYSGAKGRSPRTTISVHPDRRGLVLCGAVVRWGEGVIGVV